MELLMNKATKPKPWSQKKEILKKRYASLSDEDLTHKKGHEDIYNRGFFFISHKRYGIPFGIKRRNQKIIEIKVNQTCTRNSLLFYG